MSENTQGGNVTFGQVAQAVNAWGLSELIALNAMISARINLLSTRGGKPQSGASQRAARTGPPLTIFNRQRKPVRALAARGPTITASQFDHVTEYQEYQQAKKIIAKLVKEKQVSGLSSLRDANLPDTIDALQRYDAALRKWIDWKTQYYTAHPERRPGQQQQQITPTAESPHLTGARAGMNVDGNHPHPAANSTPDPISTPVRRPRRRRGGSRGPSGNPRPKAMPKA